MADSQPGRIRETGQKNRLTKGLMARIAGVALFVAIGTAAVVYMMNRGTMSAKSSENDSAIESELSENNTAGFAPQVQASFAESPTTSLNANFASFTPTPSPPIDQAELKTTTPADLAFNSSPDLPKKESAGSLPPGPPATGPPDRFASLDGPIRSGIREQEPAAGAGNGLKPDFGPLPTKPPTQPESRGLSFGDSDSFAPNPAGFNRAAERPDAEPLKPFSPPDLPNRIAASNDLDAPKLKAPVPETNLNSGSDSGFEPKPPKLANNLSSEFPTNRPNSSPANQFATNRVDSAGPVATADDPTNNRGILKPFEPSSEARSSQNEPAASAPPQQDLFGRVPAQSPRTNDANLLGDAKPVKSPEDQNLDRATRDELASPLRSTDPRASSPPPVSTSSDGLGPAPFPNTPANRPVAQPVSSPLSSGSPINQPLSEPSRQPSVFGMGGVSAVPEPRTANQPGDRRLDGLQAPALTVEKLAPKEISVNETADFVIVIRNVGRVDASDVVVHDQVPANTDFQSSNPPPQQSSGGDRRLNWELGTIKSGQEKRIQYQLKPTAPGEIGSVAHVTFSTQASMRTTVTRPELEIIHRSKPVVMVGSDVILDVVITNKGNGPAKNVLIQEDVPIQLQFQEGFRELEYEVGTLLPGQSKRVQLGLKAVDVGRVKNLIIATAAGGQRSQHEIELEIVAPKLIANADGPTKRFLGRQVVHQFKVANQGTASASNVDLIAKLPPGLRFVGANNQGVYRQANHAVYWSMAELTANGDASVELTTMPIEVGNQDIKFEVKADLNQKADLVQALNIEHLVDIFFDIDDLVDPIEVGADTAYQIKVANQGTQLANNIQLQVDFPNGIVPISVDSNLPHQVNGQRVQFSPLNNLKPGEQLTLTIRAKGQIPGDHRVVVTLQADGRQSAVAKEEITRVYADR